MYSGVSKEHVSSVAKNLNITTGNISLQFHVVRDKLFTTVTNPGAMNIDEERFDEGKWRKLVCSGHEKYINEDKDITEKSTSIPHLH